MGGIGSGRSLRSGLFLRLENPGGTDIVGVIKNKKGLCRFP